MTLRQNLAILLLVAVGVFFLSHAFTATSWGKGEREDGCRECHASGSASKGLRDIYAEMDAFPYRHPATDVSCEVCHIQSSFRPKRQWEMASLERQREQVFFVKDLTWDRQYDIEARFKDQDGKTSVVPIKFIPSEIDSEVDNDFVPPMIKDVRVEDIAKAVFIEAIVRWETDEAATSIVEFGATQRYGERAGQEAVFTKGHSVRVSGLKAGRSYHFRAVSRDMFGNTSLSKDFVIDTASPVKADKKAEPLDRGRGERAVKVFRNKYGREVFVHLEAGRPVSMSLSFREAVEKDKHGFGLAPPKTSQIEACVKCHSQAQSHPVGVRGDGVNVRIPPELPTIDGGMMTCNTCHYPHGGTRRYFARINLQTDFCTDCHIGKE